MSSVKPRSSRGSYLFIICLHREEKRRKRRTGGTRETREYTACACDTTQQYARAERHRVTYIVMVPPLVSKIGCRATTFETTRGLLYGRALLSARDENSIRANIRQLYNPAGHLRISPDVIYLMNHFIKRLLVIHDVKRFSIRSENHIVLRVLLADYVSRACRYF